MTKEIEIKDFSRWIPLKDFLQVSAALSRYFMSPRAGNEEGVFVLGNERLSREEFLMCVLSEADTRMNEPRGHMYFTYAEKFLDITSHSGIELERIDGFPTFYILRLEIDGNRDAEDKLAFEMGIERGLQFAQVSVPLPVEKDRFLLDCSHVIKRLRTIGAFQFMEMNGQTLACLLGQANETGIIPFPELCDNGFRIQLSIDGVYSPAYRTRGDNSFVWIKEGAIIKGRPIEESVPVINFFIQKSQIGNGYPSLPFIEQAEKERCRAAAQEIAAAFEEK